MAPVQTKPLRRLVRMLRFVAPGIVLLVVILARWVHANSPTPEVTDTPKSTATAPAVLGAPAQKVVVGLYLQNVPEIDIKTNSFAAEFYLWFVWDGPIDPTLTYELTNVVNVSELTKVPVFVDANGN